MVKKGQYCKLAVRDGDRNKYEFKALQEQVIAGAECLFITPVKNICTGKKVGGLMSARLCGWVKVEENR